VQTALLNLCINEGSFRELVAHQYSEINHPTLHHLVRMVNNRITKYSNTSCMLWKMDLRELSH
jgi:hypothetical protein